MGRVVSDVPTPISLWREKCFENAKIGTLRADWLAGGCLWCEFIEHKNGGGCIMWSLIDNRLLRERSLITCGGGSESLPQNSSHVDRASKYMC